jgi:hypothetical protein
LKYWTESVHQRWILVQEGDKRPQRTFLIQVENHSDLFLQPHPEGNQLIIRRNSCDPTRECIFDDPFIKSAVDNRVLEVQQGFNWKNLVVLVPVSGRSYQKWEFVPTDRTIHSLESDRVFNARDYIYEIRNVIQVYTLNYLKPYSQLFTLFPADPSPAFPEIPFVIQAEGHVDCVFELMEGLPKELPKLVLDCPSGDSSQH